MCVSPSCGIIDLPSLSYHVYNFFFIHAQKNELTYVVNACSVSREYFNVQAASVRLKSTRSGPWYNKT
jgi:hypothetical protein